jgi:hypothetical protein
MDVHALPILSCPLCCANTIGAAICSPLIGEAQQIKKIRENFLLALQIRRASPIGAAKALHFAFKQRERRSTSKHSIQRQYSWRYVARSASLICPERAYKCGSTDWKWKYGKNKMKVNQNEKIMSSATI